MVIKCYITYMHSMNYIYLLLRKSEEPEQRSLPSAIIAILSPKISASSLVVSVATTVGV